MNGKYLKDGVEVITNSDGSIKSKKYYKLDIEIENPENIPPPISSNIKVTEKCSSEAILVGENCVPRSGVIWKGRYSCPLFQGETELVFTMGTDDVRATFEFTAKNGHGKYFMRGNYSPEKKILTFEPVEWILKAKNYTMVGMSGIVNYDEHTYKGRMDGCALFDLKVQL